MSYFARVLFSSLLLWIALFLLAWHFMPHNWGSAALFYLIFLFIGFLYNRRSS